MLRLRLTSAQLGRPSQSEFVTRIIELAIDKST
jgi:hypothetical protein